MHVLTTESFRNLLAARRSPCVSIYMPTVVGPRAFDHNRLHYDHLLESARRELAAHCTEREIGALLEPILRFPTGELWNTHGVGWAAFASPEMSEHFQLAGPPEELACVGDSFHLRPLMSELQSNRHYFLLSLTQKHVRFYRGSRLGLVPSELRGAPVAVEAHPRGHETFSSRHPGSAGGGMAIHHGRVGGDQGHDAEIAAFLRETERALQHELAFETSPLVLVAPVALQAAYRSVSRYPHLLDDGLHGSYDSLNAAELHEKAWPIVATELRSREDHMLDDFGSLAARGRATDDPAEIARFGVQGRVRRLFLADGEHLWGRLDRDTGAVEFAAQNGIVRGDDILDDLAEAVLARGGEVVALERARMPRAATVAAVLRW